MDSQKSGQMEGLQGEKPTELSRFEMYIGWIKESDDTHNPESAKKA